MSEIEGRKAILVLTTGVDTFSRITYDQTRKKLQEAGVAVYAIGLMQITPATARGIALRTGGTAFRVSDLTDPAINIRYGSWYLQNLFAKYGDERLVLAAYNAGQGNVDRWLEAGQEIEFAETRAYVDRVTKLERVYRDAWRSELYAGS